MTRLVQSEAARGLRCLLLKCNNFLLLPALGVDTWRSQAQMSFRDTGYLPFYFQGYRILSILLQGIWDTWLNIFVTSRDIENLGKLVMGIFVNL